MFCSSNFTGSGCDKCTADQYGPDCSVKCKAESSLTTNYTCNATTGKQPFPSHSLFFINGMVYALYDNGHVGKAAEYW